MVGALSIVRFRTPIKNLGISHILLFNYLSIVTNVDPNLSWYTLFFALVAVLSEIYRIANKLNFKVNLKRV